MIVTCTFCDRHELVEDADDLYWDCGICSKCHVGYVRRVDVDGMLVIEDES